MTTTTLIPELATFAGRIMDVDSHEMIPAQEWKNIFGREAGILADIFIAHAETEEQNINTSSIPDYAGDVAPIDAGIINVKGARAPGAMRVERRIEVMDAMGVRSQLLFPTGLPLLGVSLLSAADDPTYMPEVTTDRHGLPLRWFDLYNEWAIDQARISPRIVPTAVLYGDTPERIIDNARRLVTSGIQAIVYLPVKSMPGRRSPAHSDLDPLWAVLAEAGCTFTLHIESEPPAPKGSWRDATPFEGFIQHGEISTDPPYLAMLHQSYENFLTYMILGGVFDRHPTLRVLVAEVGSHWVGPLLERLDLWWRMGDKFGRQGSAAAPYRLPHPPSAYFRSNIRVSPFPFEDMGTMLHRYADLADILCFSTDYPHVEGGRDAFSIFHGQISRFGPQVVEKFFVDNAAIIMPT